MSSITLETPLPSPDCIPATPAPAVFFVSLGCYDGPAEDNDTRKELLALRKFLNSPLANGRRVIVALSFTDLFNEKITKIDPKITFSEYTGTYLASGWLVGWLVGFLASGPDLALPFI